MIEWFDGVLDDHPNHLAAVTTYEFINGQANIVTPVLRSAIANHCNVIMVHSGHWSAGPAPGQFDDGCGRSVHRLVTNYQGYPRAAKPGLRTIDIGPITARAESVVYSPWLDEYATSPAEALTMELAPLDSVAGDALCDGTVDSIDADAMLAYLIGSRAGRTGCPIALESEMTGADVTADSQVEVSDAWALASCLAGRANPYCPNLAGG